MTKFSIWRGELEEEEEEEEENCVRSSKKRRTSLPLNSSSTSQSNSNNEQNQSEEQQHNSSNSTHVSNNSNNISGGPLSFILSDPDVLDCPICFDPLTVPVFQCDNGHIACSSCCSSLGNKCPSCCGKFGNNRCRAIEKVIESVKVSCCYVKNGCSEPVSYCKKHEHEEKCNFAPCLCPFTNCVFRGTTRKLSHHMQKEHSDLVVQFRFNSVFSVSMRMDESFVVLQEERDGALFILSHGNTVAVRCIGSSSSKEGFKYDIVLRSGCSSLKFQSSTHCTTGQLSLPLAEDYVMVPGYFYHTEPGLELDICVWSRDGSSRSS